MLTGHNIVTTLDQRGTSSAPASPSRTASGTAADPPRLVRQLSRSSSAHTWLGPLAKAYVHIYSHQKEILNSSRDFYGMRDYYSLLKFLRQEISIELTPQDLIRAVARNFGGRPDSMKILLPIFYESCFPSSSQSPLSSPRQTSTSIADISDTPTTVTITRTKSSGRKSKSSDKSVSKEERRDSSPPLVLSLPSDQTIPPSIDMIRENVACKTSR